ncbi:MAG: TIGR02556 family CRISPR-associated protein [Senegalia sp. (in: firmicutes)]|uniref:TIGR02556 family CRISPR-associated protein n=1 Tax=Senegalia sp. (in: firmicutes) TaxID=1924098 RepID=UPI003F99802E
MQEGIKQVGEAIYDEENAILNLVKDIKYKDKKENYLNIIQINFNTDINKIEIKNYGEAKMNSPQELLWIGTASGPASPQWYTTGNKAEYLISQTIPNIVSMNIGDLSEELKVIVENFYFDMGEQKGAKKKFRYIIDTNKVDGEFEDVKQIYEHNDKDVKKTIKDVSKKLDNFIKGNLNLKTKDIALYFLTINEEKISNNKEYKNAIKEEMYSLDENLPKDYCSVCSKNSQVTSDTSKLQLKFYTTTNINFPSGFSKSNYNKNMQICEECMSFLMSGEQYIKDNLSSRLGGMPIYIIPHFLFEPDLSKKKMDEISKNIQKTFNESKNVGGIENFRDELIETTPEDNEFLLNILFYKINQQSVKVQRLIKDVNPSRFGELIIASKGIQRRFEDLISNNLKIPLGLQSVYYLTPVKVKTGEVQDFRKLLALYDAIFKEVKIKKEVLITNFLNMIKIHYYNKENQFNIKPSRFFSKSIIQSHMLIKYLEKINCLKEGEGMDLDSIILDEEIKNYMKEMNYSEQEASMFLLGYLVSQVGNRQRMEREGKKPILNKINFNSMDLNKVKRLSNEIPDKLRQNKILKYNEKQYFAHKKLMDKHRNDWQLSKHDNLYYIMSGYAYGTTKLIYKKGNEDD